MEQRCVFSVIIRVKAAQNELGQQILADFEEAFPSQGTKVKFSLAETLPTELSSASTSFYFWIILVTFKVRLLLEHNCCSEVCMLVKEYPKHCVWPYRPQWGHEPLASNPGVSLHIAAYLSDTKGLCMSRGSQAPAVCWHAAIRFVSGSLSTDTDLGKG